jgi:hypothetical protein
MAPRKRKIEHRFVIIKENLPGSAYLLLHNTDVAMERDPVTGHLNLDLDALDHSFRMSAWTSLANAKRQAAQQVNRKSLRWEETGGETMSVDAEVWQVTYIEKVEP